MFQVPVGCLCASDLASLSQGFPLNDDKWSSYAGLEIFQLGLFMKQHLLSRISKLASFLVASASRATPSAPSRGDSRVLVLLLGLVSSGGAGGAACLERKG